MLAAHFLKHIIHEGTLRVVDATGRTHAFGGAVAGPASTIRLHDRSLHYKLLLNPYLHVGEAYMDGNLTFEDGDLRTFLDLVGRNVAALDSSLLGRFNLWKNHVAHTLNQFNPAPLARKRVAHHYDLSDELYDLFLDDDRQYSCAYWRTDADDLEAAQHHKKVHIASKLRIEPGVRVLDIGCGWGGLALELARQGADRVVGITLSEEQVKVANRRAREAGLDGRVEFRLEDYRHIEGPFDRIVSVGMFEHVGVRQYRAFFRTVRNLLTDDGVALLHSIGRMEPPGSTNAWLRKYIFPGGYTPAMSEVLGAVEKEQPLWATDIEVLRLHYAWTLREWHRRFAANRDTVKRLYDERFCRMWEFYLLGCEMAFRYWNQMVFQLQLARRQDAVPLTRDYMVDAERRLMES